MVRDAEVRSGPGVCYQTAVAAEVASAVAHLGVGVWCRQAPAGCACGWFFAAWSSTRVKCSARSSPSAS